MVVTVLIISNIASFVLGLALGYFLKCKMANKPNVKNVIAYTVAFIWLVSILFEMFGGTGYTTNYLIHGLMGMIAGYFYKRGSEGNGSEQTKA